MKRLIVVSDGLWTSASVPEDSNLGILARTLKNVSCDNIAQITLIDPFQAVIADGKSGRRTDFLRQSICALYLQLVHNYSPGDSLWFFGFSRGSFVVRSCIGLIRNVGLLKKTHVSQLPDAWHIYRTRWGADARNAQLFRKAYCHRPTIKFLGVFDTVGILGIPAAASPEPPEDCPYFHDNVLSGVVEFACHALAIDEWRRDFEACLWRTQPERTQTEQCWFTGSHKDIGGIQGDSALSNIALRWMISRATALGLAIDNAFLDKATALRAEEHTEDYNSGRVRKTGTNARPIGLINSDETLHPSAEQRFLRNQGYRPSNLKAYIQRDSQIQLPL